MAPAAQGSHHSPTAVASRTGEVTAAADDAPGRPRLGLVVGGAGVRGFGQAGALGALARAGLQPDVVVGVSTGAIVAATYAARTDWEHALQQVDRSRLPALADADPDADRLERLRAALRSARQLAPSVWTWGLEGYEEYARRTLGELLGEGRVDGLRLPLALVATDLAASRRAVLRSGSLVEATLAASALPAVTDPIALEGGLLVDGSFADPAPVDVARDLGADVVLVVHVERPLDEPELDSWPRALARGVEIGGRTFVEERLARADVVVRARLRPDVRALDFSAIDAVARHVAGAVRDHLGDLREALGVG